MDTAEDKLHRLRRSLHAIWSELQNIRPERDAMASEMQLETQRKNIDQLLFNTADVPPITAFQMESVSSSNIKALAYDDQSMNLIVEFNSGGQYRYLDVEPETYKQLYGAVSVGKAYHRIIKGKYPCKKLL